MGSIPKTRWYQFSLRSSFVALTGVAALLGIWLACIGPAERQRAAVRRAKALGGNAGYVASPKEEPWHVTKLREWLPRDYFDSVEGINLGRRQITDDELEYFRGLTQVQGLALDRSSITDIGLAHLETLPELKELFLSRTQVTDAGLVHLKKLTKLQVVYLDGTRVTDAGVAELQKALPNCSISRTPP
jgi:hypothetical protein